MEKGRAGSNPSISIANLDIHFTSKRPQVVTQISSVSSGSSSSSSLGCKEGHCTSTRNNFVPQNSSKNGGKSRSHGTKFLGVRQRPSGRWVAEIKDASQKLRLWLGTFDCAEDAARAYDDAARFLRGKNTRTNFAAPGNSIHMQPNSSKASRLLLLRHALAKAAQNTTTRQGKYHATADVCVARHLEQHPKANRDNNKNKNNVVIGGERDRDRDRDGDAMPATTRDDQHWILSSSSGKSTPYNHVGIDSLICNADIQCSLSQNFTAAPGNGQSNVPSIGTKGINQTALCYPHLANVASFDRFCTSGWNLQQSLIRPGKQHASGSEYINQSLHGKTSATIRVAPSFNASLYSEAEKILYRHAAAARSSESAIVANGS